MEMLSRISRRYLCTATPQPWLFVGLGNLGDKYKTIRHNVGFKMIDAFTELQGIPVDTVHCKALFGKGFVDDVSVFLAKPQTYMNLSGESTLESSAELDASITFMVHSRHGKVGGRRHQLLSVGKPLLLLISLRCGEMGCRLDLSHS